VGVCSLVPIDPTLAGALPQRGGCGTFFGFGSLSLTGANGGVGFDFDFGIVFMKPRELC
jgi:hypothetical protein